MQQRFSVLKTELEETNLSLHSSQVGCIITKKTSEIYMHSSWGNLFLLSLSQDWVSNLSKALHIVEYEVIWKIILQYFQTLCNFIINYVVYLFYDYKSADLYNTWLYLYTQYRAGRFCLKPKKRKKAVVLMRSYSGSLTCSKLRNLSVWITTHGEIMKHPFQSRLHVLVNENSRDKFKPKKFKTT